MTEVAEGGRVEGTIRSKALVVREGALFSGQASIDLQDAPGGADGSAYPEDELQMGYEESVRRAAEWYRSTLFGPTAEPDHNGAQEPDAPGMSEPDDHADRGDGSRPFPRVTLSAIDGSRAEENADVAKWAPERSNPTQAKQLVSRAYRQFVPPRAESGTGPMEDEDARGRRQMCGSQPLK